MEQLTNEHIEARERVSGLASAKAEDEAVTCIETLVELYPWHIAREDKEFFIPVMHYFSDAEKEDMLREGNEFDQKMIHEKYQAVIEELSNRG